MANPYRTRLIEDRCPRCRAQLQVTEMGLTVDQQAGPLGWQTVNIGCSSGCPITVGDFPNYPDLTTT